MRLGFIVIIASALACAAQARADTVAFQVGEWLARQGGTPANGFMLGPAALLAVRHASHSPRHRGPAIPDSGTARCNC